jgi:uncharacterized protein (DUF1697 family)
LRAVNVGGTQRLSMAELKAMCAEIGFQNIETYIASGNVVFSSSLDIQTCQAQMEQRIALHFGKPVGVLLRTAQDLDTVIGANPFADVAPNKVQVLFLDSLAHPDMLRMIRNQKDEILHLGQREVLIAYPNGMGQSRLVIEAAKSGTMRNMNTVQTLAEMARI